MPFSTPAFRVLDDNFPRCAYQPHAATTANSSAPVVRKGLHFGQRKLLLSEVEFLTVVTAIRKQQRLGTAEIGEKPLLVVYAGAANGLHLPFLFTLFPNVKFVLVDPAPFCQPVQELAGKGADGPVRELIKGYCTGELCARIRESYKDTFEMVLVSDIRSGVPVKMTRNALHTEMMARDNELQQGYCVQLQPSYGMLKFHPPYPAEKDVNAPHYDPADTTPDVIEYLDGVQLFGVWSPKSSSEVRLVVSGPFQPDSLRQKMYDCRKHEEQCAFYNSTDRYQRDCEAEKSIWERYLAVAVPDVSPTLGPSWRTVEGISAAASAALVHPDFLPLAPGFTEDQGRWYALVSSARGSGLTEEETSSFFHQWKPHMTIRRVEELVETYRDFTAIPEKVKSGDEEHTREFWSVFCRGNFQEAYSMSKLRFGFFGQLIAVEKGKRERGHPTKGCGADPQGKRKARRTS